MIGYLPTKYRPLGQGEGVDPQCHYKTNLCECEFSKYIMIHIYLWLSLTLHLSMSCKFFG